MSKEQDLIKIAEKGGNDAVLFLLDKISSLEEKIVELETSLDEKINSKVGEKLPTIPSPISVEISGAELLTIKGDKGEQGEKGDTGNRGEQGERGIGEKGDKGDIGEQGKTFKGIDGKDGLNGKDGKDGSPDTSLQVRDKLETLNGDERLDISAIKGLDNYEEVVKYTKDVRPSFFGGKTKVYIVNLSDLLNGITKSFQLPTNYGIIAVNSSSSPFGAFLPITDYNQIGRNIVFTSNVDASIALAQGQSLTVTILK